MVVAGLVLAALAALVHVYIFVMESLTWTSAKTRAVFGTSAEEAEATKELAYNQGFYNLFLAIVTAVGIILVAAGSEAAGAALVFAGAGSMAAAAAVLFLSSPDKRGAALKQGLVPLLAVIALVVGLLI
jgi:putative membrane protein